MSYQFKKKKIILRVVLKAKILLQTEKKCIEKAPEGLTPGHQIKYLPVRGLYYEFPCRHQ